MNKKHSQFNSRISAALLSACLWLLPAAAHGQINRQQAVTALFSTSSGVPFDSTNSTAWSPYVDFGYGPGFEGLLPTNATVAPADADSGATMTLTNAAYLVWLDDNPSARFAHSTRFVFINAGTTNPTVGNGGIFVSPQQWWPVVTLSNGAPAVPFFSVSQERHSASPPGVTNTHGWLGGFAGAGVPAAPPPVTFTPSNSSPRACGLILRGGNDAGMAFDVALLEMDLVNHFGVPTNRIIKARDGFAANEADLDAAIAGICALTPEPDKIYVRLDSHGGTNGIMLADGKLYATNLCLKLRKLAAKGVPICLMIDACFSGTLLDAHNWNLPAGSSIITSANMVWSWGTDLPMTLLAGTNIVATNVVGSLFNDAFRRCLASPAADADGDGLVDDVEAFDWVKQQRPCYFGSNINIKFYPAGPPDGMPGINPDPQKRTVGRDPFATVMTVCNGTASNKTDFHIVYEGNVTNLTRVEAWRSNPDGVPLRPWATNGLTITYDATNDHTMVCWEDAADFFIPGEYLNVTIVDQQRRLRPARQFWTPTTPPPARPAAVDMMPSYWVTLGAVTGSNGLYLYAAESSDASGAITSAWKTAAAPSPIPTGQFHPGSSAVSNLDFTVHASYLLPPDKAIEFGVAKPDLPRAPLPVLIVRYDAGWQVNSNRTIELDQFILDPPPEDTICVTNCPGENQSFMLDLPGGAFQWYKDGQPIPGATSSTLALTNLMGIEQGVYTGIATNATEIKRKFFKLFVEDNVAPTINCPSNMLVAALGAGDGVRVNYQVTASDACGMVASIICDPPSGSFFPLGTNLVSCTARDTFGNTSVCTFTITVVQAANLRVSSFSFTPATNRAGSYSQTTVSGSNNGSATASNVTELVSVTPSNGVNLSSIFVSRGSVVTLSSSSLRWDIGTVSTGQTYFIALNLCATIPGRYTSTVAVATSSFQPATSDDSQSAITTFNPPFPGYGIPGVQVTEAEPVSTFSGKEIFTEPPDLNLGGPLPIFFQRQYDGALTEDGVVNSALGPNWQHNYDLSLAVNGTNATVGFRQGRLLRFEQVGANWNLTERTDVPFRLLQNGPDFVLGDPRSQFMYFFNAGGQLTRIEDGRGNTNFLAYSGTLLTNVNDGLNRQLTLQYDGAGQLTNVTDGARSVQFVHGSPLASVVDALGLVTSYSYTTNTNNAALLTARTLPEGNTPFSQVYNAEGRVRAQTDGASNTTTFAYAAAFAGRQTVITNPLGHVTTHLYTANGEFDQFTDEAGKSVILGQDAAGRRNSIRDRLTNTTSITYSATNGFPTLINLPANPDESFAYSPRVVNGFTFFDLTRTVHPDGTTNLLGYDAQGNLVSHTNRVGDVWRYGYNARGQLLAITNPLGGTATFTYDANARLVSSTDSDIGVTSYDYDSLNRLTNVTHPNPTTRRFAHDALDRLTSVTDERTNTSSFQYDGNSRLTNVVNALNQSSHFEYDAVNRLVRSVDRLGQATTFGYDPRSLLSLITNRNGFVTRLEYDPRQRLTAIVNPASVTNRLEYDDEGLLTAVINPLGETVRWQRDAMGYVTNVFDPMSNKVTFALDAMKRITNVTDSLGRKSGFAYDRRGLLTNTTREAGIAAAYRYNPLGLLTNIIDPKARQWHFAYTAVGRMTSFADPLGRAARYEYDSRGRLARTVHPDGVTQTNTYDGANNLTQLAWSDGTLFNFAYDPLNRLINAAGSDPIEFNYDAMDRVTNTRQVGLNFGATYDADGRLTSVSYSNGLLTVTYTYDSRDRLIHVGDNLTGQGMGFSHDEADRLTGITRSNGVNATYTYDARGLLTRIQEGSIIDIQYSYDAAGQVTEADYVAVPIDPTSVASNLTASFTYDAASQISTAGYQHDPRGRRTNMPNAALGWDGASRLVTISNVSLGYNALDDLATRAEGGNTNRYFYNYAIGLTPIMAERNENTGQFTRCYVWSPGGLLLYLINLPGNTVSYPHFDRVGSTLALSGAGGAITDAYAYDLYGRLITRIGTNQQPFQFVGRSGVRGEPAGNLAQMRARYYDPRAARFLSPEPIWPDRVNPKKLNPYQYALQDPLTFIDPEGTDDEEAQKSTYDRAREVIDEIVKLMKAKNERRLRRPLTESEMLDLEEHYWDDYADDGRHMQNVEKLEKLLEKLRKEQKAYDESQRKAQEEARRDAARRAAEDARKGKKPGAAVIGPAVTPGESAAPNPVVPFPGTDPTPPAGGSPAPEGDVHGFMFGAGAGGGVPVSYSSPDSYQYFPHPLSRKVQGLIFGADGALTHQGPASYLGYERVYTSEAEAIGPVSNDEWLRSALHY